jgi:hypothetical protein
MKIIYIVDTAKLPVEIQEAVYAAAEAVITPGMVKVDHWQIHKPDPGHPDLGYVNSADMYDVLVKACRE